MSSFVMALIGSLVFVLAYTYYVVAGMFNFPGGDAVSLILVFGGGLLSTLLMALVLTASVSFPPRMGQDGDRAKQEPRESPQPPAT